MFERDDAMSDEAKPAGELDLNAIRGQLNLPEGAGEKEIIGALLQVIAAINAKYEQLLANRDATLAVLTGLRTAKATPPPPAGSPPPDLGPRTSALDPGRSAPLRNRLPAAAANLTPCRPRSMTFAGRFCAGLTPRASSTG
jgi:hypothetical protein